jgi:inorganic pyrophosphatase
MVTDALLGCNRSVDEPFSATGEVHVLIETPQGQPNKFKYDAELGALRLSRVLPVGMVFPYDFGCLPGTRAEDGDPLDVLVLMNAPAYPGTVVEARLIGVLRCMQGKQGKRAVRNDRLIAVATEATTYHARELRDLDRQFMAEIEAFFVDYNRIAGRRFEVIRRSGRKAAMAIVSGAKEPQAEPARPGGDGSRGVATA